MTSNATLIERGKQHGNAFDQFGLAQNLKNIMRAAKSWNIMTDQQRETIEMACTKLSRIGEGDPGHLDHWTDLAGYFELTAIIMQGKKV